MSAKRNRAWTHREMAARLFLDLTPSEQRIALAEVLSGRAVKLGRPLTDREAAAVVDMLGANELESTD